MSLSPPASPPSQPDRGPSLSSGVPFEISAAVVVFSILTDVYRSLSGDFTVGFGGNWEHMALARSLVAGHGFANPFSEHFTGPTAAYAPIHPAMLGALLAVFGDRPSTVIPAVLLEAAIRAACLFLLLRISMLAFDTWTPGALASVVLIFGTRPEPQWEGASAWLAIEVVALLLLAKRNSIWSGAAMGLGWLLSPSLIPASLAMALLLRGRRAVVAAGGVAVLVVAPWIVRNAIVFRQLVIVRDNYGLELRISNNDLAGPREDDAPERFQQWHPGGSAEVAAALVQTGEPKYFSELRKSAIVWIREHPRRFLALTAARLGLWWISNWLLGIVSVLAAIGLWWNRETSFARAAGAALVLFPIPYYVVQFHPRYMYPVLWIAALFAGYAVIQLVERFFADPRPRKNRSAHAVAPLETRG